MNGSRSCVTPSRAAMASPGRVITPAVGDDAAALCCCCACSTAHDRACSRPRVMTSAAPSMQNANAPTAVPTMTVMTHLATLAVCRPAP